MTEQEWLSSDDPQAMLQWMTDAGPGQPLLHVNDRKLRLFACACVRQVWDRLEHVVSRMTVELAERYADGKCSWEMLERSERRHDALSDYNPVDFLVNICSYDANVIATTALPARNREIPPATQAALLRDIFGNIFQPQVAAYFLCPNKAGKRIPLPTEEWVDVLCWNDDTVPRMARAIYDDRQWQLMPILADALLDAGCDNEELMQHCRGMEWCGFCEGRGIRSYQSGSDELCHICQGTTWVPLRGPHCRGCWCLDLLLGRE